MRRPSEGCRGMCRFAARSLGSNRAPIRPSGPSSSGSRSMIPTASCVPVLVAHCARPKPRSHELPWWRRAVAEEWRNQAAVESIGARLHSGASPASLSLLDAAIAGKRLLVRGVGRGGTVQRGHRSRIAKGGVCRERSGHVRCRRGRGRPALRRFLPGAARVGARPARRRDRRVPARRRDVAEPRPGRHLVRRHPRRRRTAGRRAAAPSGSPSDEDRQLAAKQKICPVTGNRSDSMGGPVRVEVEGGSCSSAARDARGPAQGSGEISRNCRQVKRDATMIERVIEFSIRNRWLVIAAGAAAGAGRHLRRLSHARRCHPRLVRKPGDRLHGMARTQSRRRSRTRSLTRCRCTCKGLRAFASSGRRAISISR